MVAQRTLRVLCRSVSVGRRWHSGGPRVAIIGSGPAGMFTCASLMRKSADCQVDIFDAAPVPFGLVRYGVAPDHQEVKNCIHGFERMFAAHPDRVSLFCNVRVGDNADVKFAELTEHYDAVLLAYGAHRPRRLQIPGWEATNIFSGSEFVSWYNGVPSATAPLLDKPNVVVVGNGNVALDCSRILSSPREVLAATDIPDEQLRQLGESAVRQIRILGRRGAENVSFTIKELREQFRVGGGWHSWAEMGEEEMGVLREAVLKRDRRRKRMLQVMLDHASPASCGKSGKECRFQFHRVSKELLRDSTGRVSGVRVAHAQSGVEETLPCDLLIYSIGYETVVLDGVPKSNKGAIAMRDECRVEGDAPVYAAGWCAHGPKGVIVDTQQDAVHVAAKMLDELKGKQATGSGVGDVLRERGVRFVSFSDWKEIDEEETRKGAETGKVREKLKQFEQFIKK